MPRWFSWVSVDIIDRIVKRFQLQETPIEPGLDWTVVKNIQPVTQVDALLISIKMDTATKDISGAGGGYITYFTVPKGKRWRLKALHMQASTGNTKAAITDGVAVFSFSATTTNGYYIYLLDLPLDTGWKIDGLETNNGADTAIFMVILYEEEDAY